MAPVNLQPVYAASRGGARLLVTAAAVFVLAVVLFPVGGSATVGDYGYRDQHYSGTGTAVTGAKPESKLWWNDGIWWGVMWDGSSNTIFRLDQTTQTWVSTGVGADNRAGTRSDCLWDGTHLYIASHGFTNIVSSGYPARLYRYSYNAATKTYALDSGFPVNINNYKTETLVIDKDTTGRLWATWNQGTVIYVNATTGDDRTWGVPFALPVTGAGAVDTDDISSVIAFNGRIGVMWSNQVDQKDYFAVHVDGDPTTTWQPSEVALSGTLAADDHINLKADASGRVYAAVKTSLSNFNDPLVELLVRDPATRHWSNYVYGLHQDGHTRPIVLLDVTNGVIHMFATSGEAGGTIYEKTSPMNNISFPSGLGTPFVRDAASADMNNATSTKQNLTAATGLVVLASNDNTDYYWHNVESLGSAPPPPVASFSGTPTAGNAPLTVNFSDTSTGSPTAWSWDFGDGGTSTLQNPSHSYANPGTYTVSLTAANTGGTSTATKTGYISVGAPPTPVAASFTGTPTSGTAPLAVQFTDTSTGSPTSWSWNFGDGGTSTAQNPLHTYTAAGTYTVSLTASNATSSNTATMTGYVVVSPPPAPTAAFTATPTSGAAPLNVQFTDTSTGSPTSWSWDFGDGTTSTAQNPSHTYAQGTYTVTLTATNASGSNTTTQTNLVTVTPPPSVVTLTPMADAYVSKQSPTSNYGADTVLKVKNGGTATTAPYYHTYLMFNVSGLAAPVVGARLRLYCVDAAPNGGTVYSADSLWTETGINWANAPPPAPGGLASVGPVNLNAWVDVNIPASVFASGNGTYTLEVQSDNPADLGSGYSSREGANPPQLALTLGSAPPPPDASFSGTPTSGFAPLTVSFTDASTGNPTSWLWDFGDGTTSAQQNPTHTYANAGTYTVSLHVANAGGNDTAVQTNYISAILPPAPVASFGGTPTTGVVPFSVAFTDTSTNNPTSWLWDFGDGTTSTLQNPTHTYTTPGTYTVKLTASNLGGSDTSTATDYVVANAPPPPVASFNGLPTNGTVPLAVSFVDTSTGNPTSWSWDFGDGTNSTQQNPTHTYTTPGTYTVKLTASNLGGSNTVTATNYITATPPPPPTASFSGTPTSGTTPLAVQFTDTSTGNPTSWSWDFGDGTTSTLQNPSHTYVNPGTYTVTLTATNLGGSNTATATNYVTASAPPPVASFTGSPTSGAVPLTVNFTDTSTGNPTSWSWDFGDGATSTLQNPSHTYTLSGTYTVKLTATNSTTSDTMTKTGYIVVTQPVATLVPVADSYVSKTAPTTNYGTATTVLVKNGGTSTTAPHYHPYFRFSVTGLTTTVTAAKLRLYVTDACNDAGTLYAVGSGWTETGITWNNAPPIGGTALGHVGAVTIGTWIEIPLPASTFASGNGSYDFAMQSNVIGAGTCAYSSREGSNPPQLVLTQG